MATVDERTAPGTLLQSVQRAARLLRVVARERRPVPIRELSALLEVNRSTCYHLVNTLEHEGLLRRDAQGRVVLGTAVVALFHGLAASLTPDPRLVECLDVLNKRTGETSYVGVWDEGDVVTVAVRDGFRGVRVRSVDLGYRRHVHARALSRAILAYRPAALVAEILSQEPLEALTPFTETDPQRILALLAEVRATGVAVEREEFTLGVCCTGAAVFDATGEAVAAFSVSVPKARFDVEGAAIADTVDEIARLATARLGGVRVEAQP